VLVGFNATNDKLILDTDITLSGNITATNKVIGTVADLEYTYTRSSKTLISISGVCNISIKGNAYCNF
jgi:hypothetical protein